MAIKLSFILALLSAIMTLIQTSTLAHKHSAQESQMNKLAQPVEAEVIIKTEAPEPDVRA